MTKKITLILVLFLSANLLAQVTNEGKPISWKLKGIDKSTHTIKLPTFDLKVLQSEDLVNDKLAMPWRFGYKFNVNYGFEDGQWTTLENGDRIWRINFSSKNALALNVIFDQFYMPEGGKIYLYNNDRSDLLGAYTSTQNQKSESLGTWLVQGENLWIEYFEPLSAMGQGKLHIGSITHSYRNAETYNEAKGLNNSGDCNLDVDCPIGADWEVHKDNNKKAVALLISGGSSFCSGALVNNTANDQKGYFLTANHCYSTPTNWSFRFGWISPNPVCAATTNSTNGPTNMTISGATFRAKNANSDFALIEINTAIPTSWDRTWAGWDKSDNNPTFEVGIHHPSGDIMKICRDNTGAVQGSNAGAFTWQVQGGADGGWEVGVTEPGSSGSPLFDQDGRIIGQLYGGGAACSGTTDNGAIDYYGRFGISWDAIAGNANQLKPWLDPTNSNVDTIDSYPPLQTFALDASISVNIPTVACGISQVQPELIIRNAGSTTLTSATIIWNNGGSDNTINWTGSLAENTTETIALGVMNVNGTLTITATISNPNNGTDENNNNDTASSGITIDNYLTTQVHLDLLTDTYSDETTWLFKDSSNTTLYSGGPYNGTTEDNTHFLFDFDVNLNECYTFVINDTAQDGICCGFGNGSYELTDDNGNVIILGGEFGGTEETIISIKATASLNDYLKTNISIFPNPTAGVLNVNLKNLSGEFSYSISNILGQTINEGSLLNDTNTLTIDDTEGVYFLKITEVSSQNYMIKKIIFIK